MAQKKETPKVIGRPINPDRGRSKTVSGRLYEKQEEYIIEKYGGVTAALKSLLPDNLKFEKQTNKKIIICKLYY